MSVSPNDFPTTRWSLVAKASRISEDEQARALATLCENYWQPLYVFLRRTGHSPDSAMETLQGFFAAFLGRNYLADASAEKGRFRCYLLGSLRHFEANERERERAIKRGGGRPCVSLDLDAQDGERRFLGEPHTDIDPEKLFHRRWAMSVVNGALMRLRERYEAMGEQRLYDYLVGFLVGTTAEESYAEAATRLDMSASAVRMAVHRLRKRFRDTLHHQVADTLLNAADVDDELRFLFAVLADV
ncbi:MAG: sigma-70 family RNA polymerase sigma factor [Acidobacteria bacterium]|nr:sigma-70 family RNA polymerase sigma factor [Acidobacteriota bacterium]